MINEEKLFKLLPYFFDRPIRRALGDRPERVPVGRRNWPYSQRDRLEVEDDGSGADNPLALAASPNQTGPQRSRRTRCRQAGVCFLMRFREVTSRAFSEP